MATIKHNASGKILHNSGGKIVNDCVACEHCDTGTTPTTKTVTLGGTISNGTCGSCAGIAGAYILTQEDIGVGADPCELSLIVPNACGSNQLTLRMVIFSTFVEVSGGLGVATGDTFAFQKTGLTAPFDCDGDINGSYTFSSQNPVVCDYSAMTLTVS
jgi:hypothetical protein